MVTCKKHHASGLAITGGSIVTMDSAVPQVEAVVCLGGRIIWTGRRVDLPRLPGVRLRHVDLKGRLMLPAFCDGHTHFLFTALGKLRIDLSEAHSLRDALRLIRSGLKALPRTAWVLGAGFNKNVWPEGDRLRKEDLDAVIPDRPAAFFSKDEHALWVNSKALKLGGIGPDTPDPAGGRIERDLTTGEPTGYLTENAFHMVWNKVPSAPLSVSEKVVQSTIAQAYEVGITQVHDVGSERSFEVFQRLRLKNKLRLRVLHALPVAKLDELTTAGMKSGLGDDVLRLGGIKVFLDGALGSQTAHMKKPFSSNRMNYGVPVYTQEEFDTIVRRAARGGWAIAVHAIGDAAVRRALDGFLKFGRKSPGAVMSRIEHVQLIDPADIPDLVRAGVAASMQPSHLPADRDMTPRHWGRRGRWAFAFRTLREAGVPLVFGSDSPIEKLDPLAGIFAAVNRKKSGDDRPPWTAKERLSVHEAVEGFTRGAAVAAGETSLKGSISPGKVADFVILSDNIFAVPPAEIANTRVEMTVFNGEVVFEYW